MKMSGQHHAPAILFQGKNPGTHRTGGSTGPRAGLDILEKRQKLAFITRVKQPDRIGVLYKGKGGPV